MSAHPLHLRPEAQASRPTLASRADRTAALSLGVAGLAAAAVLAAAASDPTPLSFAVAGLLFLVVESDVRRLQIANAVTLPALLGALVWHGFALGGAGVADALSGAGLALVLLGLPYLGGFLGAGDVKAGMALGALMGAPALAVVLVWSALLGGAVGLPWVLATGGLGDLVRRWSRSLTLTAASGRWIYFAPQEGSAAARVLPFAVFLAAGTAAALRWGAPWA